MCGSFCTFATVFPVLEQLAKDYRLIPILTHNAYETDTRFGTAADWRAKIEAACNHPIIHTIAGAEPIGPKKLLDLLIIAPCTGNTLAKLAAGISDTLVTLAAKSHRRNDRPVVVAVSTNDGLTGNAKSIGALLNTKGYFFVPFGQDDPIKKEASLVAHMDRIPATVEAALQGKQIQPLLL